MQLTGPWPRGSQGGFSARRRRPLLTVRSALTVGSLDLTGSAQEKGACKEAGLRPGGCPYS